MCIAGTGLKPVSYSLLNYRFRQGIINFNQRKD